MSNPVGNSNSANIWRHCYKDGNWFATAWLSLYWKKVENTQLNENSTQNAHIPSSNVINLSSSHYQLGKGFKPRCFSLFKKMPNEMTINILTYLREDLRNMDSVSKDFRPLVVEACNRKCRPLKLLSEIFPKEWIFKFPKAMGVDFLQKYVCDVEESDKYISIPENYVNHPRRGFNLALMPRRMILEIDENSSIELDETTAVGNNRARLVENPDRIELPLTGKTKKWIVNTTLNNLVFIFKNCLKEHFFFKFEGLHNTTSPDILHQYGDADIGPSRWIYQQDGDVFAQCSSYKNQNKRARDAGLQIAPLVDAIFFELLTYVNTGKIPSSYYTRRTSTSMADHGGRSFNSAIKWQTSGPLFRLALHLTRGDNCPGVAAIARVPAENAYDSD